MCVWRQQSHVTAHQLRLHVCVTQSQVTTYLVRDEMSVYCVALTKYTLSDHIAQDASWRRVFYLVFHLLLNLYN